MRAGCFTVDACCPNGAFYTTGMRKRLGPVDEIPSKGGGSISATQVSKGKTVASPVERRTLLHFDVVSEGAGSTCQQTECPKYPACRNAQSTRHVGRVIEAGAWGQINQAFVHWTPLRGLSGFCRKKYRIYAICFYLTLQVGIWQGRSGSLWGVEKLCSSRFQLRFAIDPPFMRLLSLDAPIQDDGSPSTPASTSWYTQQSIDSHHRAHPEVSRPPDPGTHVITSK